MTIKEIAQLAGVSASTVSKIINEKDGSINPETRRRVLTIVKKYNYIPYANIKAVSSAKTFIIGVLRRSSCCSQLVNGILQTAQSHGYNILLFDSNHSYDKELQHITALCRSNVDGVIWEPVGVNSMQSGHYLAECNIPICYVNTPHIPSACNINYKDMGYTLAKKLLLLGHQKIACLLDSKLLNAQPMLEGIQKCLYDCHTELPPQMCFYDSDEHYFHKLLSENYSAVISNSYCTALNFYQKAKSMHSDILETLSLCCLKDEQETAIPLIASMEIPYYLLGNYVADALIQNIENDIPVTPEGFSPSYSITPSTTLHAPAALFEKKMLVIGSICMDLALASEYLPESGKTTTICSSAPTIGGSGAVQALSAARLGCHVAFIGKAGKDSDVCFLYDTLQKADINTCGLFCTSDVPTGKIYRFTAPNKKTATAIFHGANLTLSADEIEKQEHLFKCSQLSLISADISDSAVLQALQLSHKHGLRTIFYPFTQKEILPTLIPYIDFFVINETEAGQLCSTHDDAAAQAAYFAALGLSTIILLQNDGSIFLKESDTEQIFSPVSSTPVSLSETTDTFLAVFSFYLLRDRTLKQSIRIAQYASSLCSQRNGMPSLPIDRFTLETYVADMEPELLDHL